MDGDRTVRSLDSALGRRGQLTEPFGHMILIDSAQTGHKIGWRRRLKGVMLPYVARGMVKTAARIERADMAQRRFFHQTAHYPPQKPEENPQRRVLELAARFCFRWTGQSGGPGWASLRFANADILGRGRCGAPSIVGTMMLKGPSSD
jgi:hypothetical protein